MKKIIHSVVFIILSISVLSSQDFYIETNFGKSFSGFGDMFGTTGNVGLKLSGKKGYFLKINAGIGHSSTSAFTEDEYKYTKNLLVADKWTENYPYSTIEGTFRNENIEQLPSSNYQNITFFDFYIGKDFSVGKKLLFSLATGLRAMKVENSYITAKIPSKITNLYGEIEGLLPVSHLVSFIEFPIVFDVGMMYKIKNNFNLGLFIHNSGGFLGKIQILSAGVKTSYKI